MPKQVPKRDRRHATSVTETRQGFVWTCSCGDYDFGAHMSYAVASAGAARHRSYMDALAKAGAVNADEA